MFVWWPNLTDRGIDAVPACMQENIRVADQDIKELQQKLLQMGTGQLKAVEARVTKLGLELGNLKGEQENLEDSVKVRVLQLGTALLFSVAQ